MIPASAMQACSFAIKSGGAPFVVYYSEGSKHKKTQAKTPWSIWPMRSSTILAPTSVSQNAMGVSPLIACAGDFSHSLAASSDPKSS